jgi:hypothetical protein
VGAAGTPVVFADQTVNHSTAPLLAVQVAAPHTAVVVEAAGQAYWPQLQHHGPVVAGVADSVPTLSALRPRYHFYVRDGRLMQLDLLTEGGPPQPRLWTTLTTEQVCSGSYISRPSVAVDHVEPHKSWLLLYSPRPGSNCFALTPTGGPEQQYRALRMDMDGNTAPLDIPEPLVALRDGAGRLTGFIVRNGALLQHTDASFGNPQDLFAAPSGLQTLGIFGTTPPGFWAYRDATRDLNLVDLSNPGSRTQLGLPQNTSCLGPVGQAMAVDGTSLYAGCGRNLVRVDQSGGAAQLATAAADISEVSLTPTRVVFRAGNELFSVPRSGGEVVALGPVGTARLFTKQGRSGALRGGSHHSWQRSFLLGGENVYTAFGRELSVSNVHRINIVRSDGSDPAQLSGAAVLNWVEPPQAPWAGPGAVHTLYIVQGEVGTGFPGATVTAFDPATRSPRFVLGTLAGNLTVSPGPIPLVPVQAGQPGLLRMLESSAVVPMLDQLYRFDSSAAGLAPVAP